MAKRESVSNFLAEGQNGRAMHKPMLALLSLGHLIADMYAGAVPALLPILVSVFGLSYGSVALVTAVQSATASIIQPLLGYISDRMPGKIVLPLAPLLAAAGVTLATQSPAFPLVLLLVSLGGIGVALFHPEGYKVASIYSGSRQSTGTSIFSVGGNLGVALGPVLVGILFALWGRPGLALLSIPGLLMALVLLRILPTIQTEAKAATMDVREALADMRPVAVPFAVLTSVVILRSLGWISLSTFVPLYAVAELKLSAAQGAQLLSYMLFSGAVGTLIGGYLADRTSKQALLFWSLVPVPVFIYLFLHSSGLWMVLALILIGAFMVSTFGVTVVMGQELLPNQRAVASGMMVGFAWGIGGIFAPVIGSFADAFGLRAALTLVMFFPIIPLVLTLVYLWLTRPESKYSKRLMARSDA